LLIPLRIMIGAAIASCYVVIGGFTYPWLQAMATQLLSYCISVGIDMRYRRIYRKLRAEEAALAAAAAKSRSAAKQEGLIDKEATASPQQVGGPLHVVVPPRGL